MKSSRFFPAHGRVARLALAPLLVILAILSASAFAQSDDVVNPSGRVAQLNYFDGPVSFEPAGYDQWAAAVLNRPLTQGDKVWNDSGARSELHVGWTTLQMGSQTSLQFTTLNDQTVQLAVTQGSAVARVRDLPAGQRFEIDTPNLALTASQPGAYRVDVDPASGTTTVTVRSGSVQVFGADGVPLAMPAGEQISFSGNGLAQVAAQMAPPEDAFGRWAAARDAAEDQAPAARYLPRDMTGYQQLDNHGTWESDPSYGEVWVPTVTVANWAPYRYGHWAYIAPWGWTWIDDEPWGFAPFHYGRWAMLGSRWCWVPGPRTVQPVYAPALVAFVGGSAGGVNFSISVGGFAQPAVGWFPLAPGEIWHPAFRASPTYVTEVNRTVIVNRNVTNITNIVNVNRTTNVYRFQNMPQAVTAVSTKAFTQGEHLRGNLVPVSATELARARVVPPPAPTRDPRAIFAASRVTQPHPAPPPAAVQRRVVSNPEAFNHGRPGTPPVREATPGTPRSPQAQSSPSREFNPAGPQRAAAPSPMRAPATNGPHESRPQPAAPHSEVTAAPRETGPAQPRQFAPRPPSAQQEQVEREQQQREQAQHAQDAERERAARAQQDQARQEQAARAAQMQAQRAQQMQEQRSQQMQRAQAQRVQQEQRAAQAREHQAAPKPRGEPHHEEKRPGQDN